MSFYRSMLAAVAAIAIATPVFADDAQSTTPAADSSTPAAAQQVADSSTQATSSADQQSTDAAQSKINLNKASAKDLMKVKGINATKARAIVAYRKKHGNFNTTEDLLKVKGFKKMKSDNLKEIQDQMSVE